MIKIKKLKSDAKIPSYAKPGDAGMDIFSNEEVLVGPNQRKLISTGIALDIGEGNVGLVWDKSGIATKTGLTTMAGVLDHTYRGELKILLYNTDTIAHKIEKGQKVAQLVVQKVVSEEIREVDHLDSTIRGERGFGSTGLT
jgi:dUTP pyrophosphatase